MCFVLLYVHYVLSVRLASRNYVDNKVSSVGSSINVKKATKSVPVSVKINNNRESVLYVGTNITYSNLKKYGINIPNNAELLLKDNTVNRHTYTLDGDYKFLTSIGGFSSKFVREYESYSTPCNTNGDGISTEIIDPDNYLAIVCNFDRDISTDPDNAKLTSIRMGCMRDESNFAYDKFMTYLATPTAYEESEDDADPSDVYSALRTDEEISDAVKDAVSTTKDYISNNYRSKSDLDYTYDDGTRTKIATMQDIANMETGKQPMPTLAPIDTSKYLTKDDFSSGIENIVYEDKKNNSDLVVRSGDLENKIVKIGYTNINFEETGGGYIKGFTTRDGTCEDLFGGSELYIKAQFETRQGGTVLELGSVCERRVFESTDSYYYFCGDFEHGGRDITIEYSAGDTWCNFDIVFNFDASSDVTDGRILSISFLSPAADFSNDKILSAAAVKSLVDGVKPETDPYMTIVYEDSRKSDNEVVRKSDINTMIVTQASGMFAAELQESADNPGYYAVADTNAYDDLLESWSLYLKGAYENGGTRVEVDELCSHDTAYADTDKVWRCPKQRDVELRADASSSPHGNFIKLFFLQGSASYAITIEKLSCERTVFFDDDKVLSKDTVEYMIKQSIGNPSSGDTSGSSGSTINRVDASGSIIGVVDKLGIQGSGNTVYDTATVDASIRTVSDNLDTLARNIGDTGTLVHDGTGDNKVVKASDLSSYLTTTDAGDTYAPIQHNHDGRYVETGSIKKSSNEAPNSKLELPTEERVKELVQNSAGPEGIHWNRRNMEFDPGFVLCTLLGSRPKTIIIHCDYADSRFILSNNRVYADVDYMVKYLKGRGFFNTDDDSKIYYVCDAHGRIQSYKIENHQCFFFTECDDNDMVDFTFDHLRYHWCVSNCGEDDGYGAARTFIVSELSEREIVITKFFNFISSYAMTRASDDDRCATARTNVSVMSFSLFFDFQFCNSECVIFDVGVPLSLMYLRLMNAGSTLNRLSIRNVDIYVNFNLCDFDSDSESLFVIGPFINYKPLSDVGCYIDGNRYRIQVTNFSDLTHLEVLSSDNGRFSMLSEDTSGIITDCPKLEYADLSGLKVSRLRDIFFSGGRCSKLKTLDISNIHFADKASVQANDHTNEFPDLETLYLSSDYAYEVVKDKFFQGFNFRKERDEMRHGHSVCKYVRER